MHCNWKLWITLTHYAFKRLTRHYLQLLFLQIATSTTAVIITMIIIIYAMWGVSISVNRFVVKF